MTWSTEERVFLIKHAYKMSDKQLTEEINCFSAKRKTLAAVRKFRQRLGLRKETEGVDIYTKKSEKF